MLFSATFSSNDSSGCATVVEDVRPVARRGRANSSACSSRDLPPFAPHDHLIPDEVESEESRTMETEESQVLNDEIGARVPSVADSSEP